MPHYEMKIDAARLRSLREHRAWSQEQLADIASLNVRTVQRVEAGGAASPETRMALAAALGVPVTLLNEVSAPGVAIEPSPSLLRRVLDHPVAGNALAGVTLACAVIAAIFIDVIFSKHFAAEMALDSLPGWLIYAPKAMWLIPLGILAIWSFRRWKRRAWIAVGFGVVGIKLMPALIAAMIITSRA